MTGKSAQAPCGHPGEHVTANFVVCLERCHLAPPRPEFLSLPLIDRLARIFLAKHRVKAVDEYSFEIAERAAVRVGVTPEQVRSWPCDEFFTPRTVKCQKCGVEP